jgi:hypothetical protein
MGNYGIKIAKAGYDYDDGDKRLVLNTTYPFLKIKSSGTGSITLSGGVGSATVVTHNLNYKPMFYVWTTYINPSTGSEVAKHRLCSWTYYTGLQRYDSYIAQATTTTITLDINTSATLDIVGGTGTDTLEYIYVVYYDPIT